MSIVVNYDDVLKYAGINAKFLKSKYHSSVVHSGWRLIPNVCLLVIAWLILTGIDMVRFDPDYHEDMIDTLDEMFDQRSPV